ncbi:putative methyltransferase-domain-containing protein [Dipodascopsis uninucleata]
MSSLESSRILAEHSVASAVASIASLPVKLPSRVFSPFTEHSLDLPSLATKPSKEVLLGILVKYSRGRARNFQDDSQLLEYAPQGIVSWLTRVIGCGLEWIDSYDDRELIWDQASKRIAERCGRTATPTMEREFDIGTNNTIKKPIVLVEPSLTADSLGLKTWGSSLLLARRFCNLEIELPKSKPVLELGAGTGLVGIVLGLLGYSVLMTDLKEILSNLSINVERNKQEFFISATENYDVKVEELNWLNVHESESFKRREKFTSIVLSDPIYSSEHPEMLKEVIKTMLNYDDTECSVVIQLPLREKFGDLRRLLWRSLTDISLGILRYGTEEGRDDFGEEIFMWVVWRPKELLSIAIDIDILP